MKRVLTKGAIAAVVTIAMITVLCPTSAQAVEITWPQPNWPEIFEPNRLLVLNLQIDPCDWDTILNDTPDPCTGCIVSPIELPAWFWMDGEEDLKIMVAVRRKKAFAFPNEADPCKVALKIDINDYYCADPCDPDCDLNLYHPNAAAEWHGLKKLSLESNADSVDPIGEGLACNLHRMASGPEGYGYDNWYANWAKVYVNGNYIGIYVNNEQRDKQFLRNRGLYIHHETWLYKYADCVPGFVLKVGDREWEDVGPKSPAVEALCYPPFVHPGDANLQPTGGVCLVPGDVNVAADMNQWVNMQGMLTMAAVDAYIANSDPLFMSSNNTYFHDFNLPDPCETRKRMYFAWDVDAILKSTSYDIYYTSSSATYEEVILQNPVFRSQYNQIMRDLLDGPLSFADVNDFLDMVEPVISSAVEADPWAMGQLAAKDFNTAADRFDGLRSWIADRITNVRNQVDFDEPMPLPGVILLQDGFEGAVWNANWTGNWVEDTTTYLRGSASASAENGQEGTFTSGNLDAGDATAIYIDFWFRKKGIEATDFTLYYYDGSSYDLAAELDPLGADNEWLHYTDTITDSQYFISNFRVQFDATLAGGELVWVDDVIVTKEGADSDGDGISDATDNCPSTYNLDQNDVDLDGLGDLCDNCLNSYNPTQADIDADGVGNVCDNCWKLNNDQTDTDGDGYGDDCDNCPNAGNNQVDIDSDDVGDTCDNCVDEANPDQNDVDLDGTGTVCDNCPNTSNPAQTDSDIDGIGDGCECDRANLDAVNPVNFKDFAIVASDWWLTGAGLAGDTNWNEVVDYEDLTQITQHWLTNCVP